MESEATSNLDFKHSERRGIKLLTDTESKNSRLEYHVQIQPHHFLLLDVENENGQIPKHVLYKI